MWAVCGLWAGGASETAALPTGDSTWVGGSASCAFQPAARCLLPIPSTHSVPTPPAHPPARPSGYKTRGASSRRGSIDVPGGAGRRGSLDCGRPDGASVNRDSVLSQSVSDVDESWLGNN